jgi:peptide/nickel transport system substrate-binding protein
LLKTLKKINWGLIWKSLSKTERVLIYTLSLVIVTSFLTICAKFYYSSTAIVPSLGGIHTEALVGIPRFINPALAQISDTDRDISRLVYSGLMKYNKDGMLIEDLAQEYSIENNTDYIFTLKENILWHDGEPLTADDIIFTIKLIQDPKYASPIRLNWQGVTIEKLDDRRVVFKLTTPYSPFLENTTVGILPKHIWENVAPASFPLAEANLQPIGSGPYKFEKFQKDSSGNIQFYNLLINDRYYNQLPFVERIVFRFFESENEAIESFKNSEATGMGFLSGFNSDQLENHVNADIYSFFLPRYFAVFLNQDNAPALAEKKVREALVLATDRDEIIDIATGGRGIPAYGPIVRELLGYNPKLEESHKFSIEEANKALDSDNWIDETGDGFREKKLAGNPDFTPLEVHLTTVQWPELEIVTRILKEQWGKIGVKVILDTFTLGELQQEYILPREYDALLFGQVVGIDPDPFSFWHSSQKRDPGLNLSLYENETVDKLLEEARQTLDSQARSDKYLLFQEEISKDIPAIFLYTPSYLYPLHAKVQGVGEGKIADPSWRFADIDQWYMETKRVWK